MTVVYIDSVFVLNTLMDYLLLLASARLAGITLLRLRYFLAAVLGGIYSVCVFLPGCGILSGWPYKLGVGCLLALTAYGGQQRLLRLILLFFAVSCAFAGCVLGLGLLAGRTVPMEGGIFYTDIDAKVLLVTAGAAYLVASVVFRACARHRVRGTLIPVTITFMGRSVTLTALCDTGNALVDPATNRTVLVVCAPAVQTLWTVEQRVLLTPQTLNHPAEILEELNQPQPRFRLIPYRAVGVSGGLLLAFRSENTVIGKRRYEGLLIALSPTAMVDGFSALWGEEVEVHAHHPTDHEKTALASGTAVPREHSLHRGK